MGRCFNFSTVKHFDQIKYQWNVLWCLNFVSRSKREYHVWLFASVWRLGFFADFKLFGVRWPNRIGFAELATLASFTSRLVSVFYSPLERFLDYLHVGLDWNYSLSWHFDTLYPNSFGELLIYQDFALWYIIYDGFLTSAVQIWWKNRPEIQENQVLRSFHWCEDREPSGSS